MRRIVPKSLRHPWLNAKDPANCVNGGKGYWVPRPEEIELKCELAETRSTKVMVKTNAVSIDHRSK